LEAVRPGEVIRSPISGDVRINLGGWRLTNIDFKGQWSVVQGRNKESYREGIRWVPMFDILSYDRAGEGE